MGSTFSCLNRDPKVRVTLIIDEEPQAFHTHNKDIGG